MFVLHCPDELIACIFVHWLGLKEVARLDSAICSSQHREEFLSLLREKCMFQTMAIDKMPVLNYVITRQLRSNAIGIDIDIERSLGVPDRISTWVHNISETLHRLTLRQMPEQFTESIVQSACHVEILKLESCELSNAVVTILEQRATREVILLSCHAICCEFTVNSEIQKLSMCHLYGPSYSYDFRISLPNQLLVLRSLDLKGEWLTKEQLIRFSLQCPNVVHLSVQSREKTESTMITIMRNFCNLQSLKINLSNDTTNHLLDVIAERHSHSLHRLSICCYEPTLSVEFHRMLSTCRHLHSLYLWSVHDSCLTALLNQHQQLTVTSLYVYNVLNSKHMQQIADHCKQIRVLGLHRSQYIVEHDLQLVMTECTQLQKVYIGHSSNKHYPGTMDITDTFRNSWPEVQFIHGDFPVFDMMSYE